MGENGNVVRGPRENSVYTPTHMHAHTDRAVVVASKTLMLINERNKTTRVTTEASCGLCELRLAMVRYIAHSI